MDGQTTFRLEYDVADINPYDQRLGLLCLHMFNNAIQYGQVYFETADWPNVTIRFDAAFKKRLTKPQQKPDGRQLHLPGSKFDRKIPGFDGKLVHVRMAQWPSKRTFDLHRFVLAPWGRAIKEKNRMEKEAKEKKAQETGNSEEDGTERKTQHRRRDKKDAEDKKEE